MYFTAYETSLFVTSSNASKLSERRTVLYQNVPEKMPVEISNKKLFKGVSKVCISRASPELT